MVLDLSGFFANVITGFSSGLGAALGLYVIYETRIKHVLDKVVRTANMHRRDRK